MSVANVSECKHDQHYTQAVSPNCNHPNSDGWPALSTGRHDTERVRPKAALARNNLIIVSLLTDLKLLKLIVFNPSSCVFPPIYLVAERVLTSNHAGKLGAEVVLQPHQLELSSLSGTISGARGGNIQQKSSISPRKMRSTEKQYVELPDVPDVSVLPDVRLKVKGDTVLKHQPGHLQLLLEDQVPELKGMKLIIHTTEKQDTVLVQISQAGKSCVLTLIYVINVLLNNKALPLR